MAIPLGCHPQKTPQFYRAYGSGENSTDLYPWALYNLYRGYRIYNPNFDAFSDVDAYQQVMLDSTANRSIRSFLRGVTSIDHYWKAIRETKDKQLHAKYQKCIDIAEDMFSYIDNQIDFRVNLASGLIRGRAYAQIVWQEKWCKLGGIFGLWKIPVLIQDEDPRRYQYFITRIPNGPIASELRRFNTNDGKWEPISKFEERQFLQLVNSNVEERFGYGETLLSVFLELLWIKTNALKYGLQGLEMHSRGIVHFAGDQTQPDQADYGTTSLETDFHNAYKGLLAGRGYIITQIQDQVKLIQGSQVDDTFLKVVEYINGEILKVPGNVLSLSSDEQMHGSYAKSEVEKTWFEMNLQHPRELIDQTITRDLWGWFRHMNYTNLYDAGLTECRIKFVTGKENMLNIEDRLKWASELHKMGYKLDPHEVFLHTGFTVQDEDFGNQLPGGVGDQTKPQEVDQDELQRGIKVEQEHTSDPLIAQEIALDHLTEDPLYYTKLAAIEQPKEAFWMLKSTDPMWQNLILDDSTRDWLQREKKLFKTTDFAKINYQPRSYWSILEQPTFEFEDYRGAAEMLLPVKTWTENSLYFARYLEVPDKIKLHAVTSSAIDLIGYLNRNLFVKFHSNPTHYLFPGVPRKVFEKFLAASSPGKFYWKKIKQYSTA